MSESDLAAAGIGVGINFEWCSAQAVVIQGASGGGTASRLLLSGHDLGEVDGQVQLPGRSRQTHALDEREEIARRK